jgi:hypothetical protein
MPATAATAKFRTAYGFWPKIPVTMWPRRPGLGLQNVVDDDLDGPRLENVRERLTQDGDEP